MNINVLITSAGNRNGKRLLKNSQKLSRIKNLQIFGTDIQKNNFNQIFQVPKLKNKKYASVISKIIKKFKIGLIIPGSDEEAIYFSQNKSKFKKLKCNISTVDFKILKKFENKRNTYKNLEKKKIRIAKWFESKNFLELKNHINYFKNKKKDFVIKPIFSRGGRNVSVIRKGLNKVIKKNFGKEIHLNEKKFFEEYLRKYKKLFPLITMERLYHPAYDLDLLSWKGKIIKTVVRKRLGPQGINGCVIEPVKREYYKYSKQIVKAFQLSWLYDCDIMLNKDKLPVLIELNPRISGSLYACIENGIPLIDDLVNLHLLKPSKIKHKKIYNKIIIRK
tara:strand:- start:318 stop:1319 length:1002 start_codon:yes stop_codon:yes gene_type:complete